MLDFFHRFDARRPLSQPLDIIGFSFQARIPVLWLKKYTRRSPSLGFPPAGTWPSFVDTVEHSAYKCILPGCRPSFLCRDHAWLSESKLFKFVVIVLVHLALPLFSAMLLLFCRMSEADLVYRVHQLLGAYPILIDRFHDLLGDRSRPAAPYRECFIEYRTLLFVWLWPPTIGSHLNNGFIHLPAEAPIAPRGPPPPMSVPVQVSSELRECCSAHNMWFHGPANAWFSTETSQATILDNFSCWTTWRAILSHSLVHSHYILLFNLLIRPLMHTSMLVQMYMPIPQPMAYMPGELMMRSYPVMGPRPPQVKPEYAQPSAPVRGHSHCVTPLHSVVGYACLLLPISDFACIIVICLQ